MVKKENNTMWVSQNFWFSFSNAFMLYSFINELIEGWTSDPLNKNIMVNFHLSLHTTQQKSKDNFNAKSPLFYLGKWYTQRLNVAPCELFRKMLFILPTRNIELLTNHICTTSKWNRWRRMLAIANHKPNTLHIKPAMLGRKQANGNPTMLDPPY